MPEWAMTVIAIVLAVVVLVVMGLVLYRKRHPRQVKRQTRDSSSNKAVAVARRFARSNRFRLIAPAHLARGEKQAQLDAIVVGYFGILGVIGLGYNGNIYGAANEAEWLQINEGGARTYFQNPLDEASAAVRVIRDALFATKMKQIPVEVVVVFTDVTAQLAISRSPGLYSLKTFKALLSKEKYLEDTGLDLDQTEAAIRAALQG